jgi:hypothetical protein
MEGFIRRQNIKRYRKLLREAKDHAERRLIQKLLLEEEQKEGAVSDDTNEQISGGDEQARGRGLSD